MEAWLLQGFLMFAPPVIGALVVRGNPMQWQRWLVWVFLSVFAYSVMHGAGWDPSRASLAIVIASVLGAFSAEIIPAIAGNLNKHTLVGLVVIGLFVWGLMYASVSEANFKNLVQWVVVGILVFVGVGAAKKG